jgi:FlaA1/EpsC-like NDP-sugar epimerase
MNFIGKTLNDLPRRKKSVLVICNDLFLSFVCWLVFGPPMATVLSSEFSSEFSALIYQQIYTFIIPAVLFIAYFYSFGYYKSLIRYFDSRDSIFLCVSGSLLFGFSWAAIYILQFNVISTSFLSIIILQGLLLSSVLYAFINISRDVAKYFLYPVEKDDNATPIIIFGSDGSANDLLQAFQNDPSKNVVALFDDSRIFKNLQINNIPIISGFDNIQKLKSLHSNLEVLLAIPNIKIERRRKIIADLEKIKVAVRTMPSLNELLSDNKKVTDIQELSINDILPGARISNAKVKNAKSKTFFISGAGGSIGAEITRQLLSSNPRIVILFELSEYNLFNIERECLAIKDSKNLDTENLANSAVKHGVHSFVMISTDKAVRPTNIMGATKRFAEIIIQSINSESSNTKFSMVRFGNVINSSGSVIPLFIDQISRGGPITVTHKDVMRYFMTIPEASNLVLQAGEMSSGGEVFILDMGEQVKIFDLARKLIHLSGRNHADGDEVNGIEIVEVGLRPGEKMYEELLISGSELKTENPKIYKATESFIEPKILKPLLAELKESIVSFDNKKILTLLSQHVEGFNR